MNLTSFWNGQYTQQMKNQTTTPIVFTPKASAFCLVMAQGTLGIPSGGGDHTVGAQFQVYVNTAASGAPADWIPCGSPVSSKAYAHADNSHVCMPMAFIPLTGTNAPAGGQQVCITIVKDPSTLAGTPGGDDYYSIAVAEIDQNVSV